MSGADKWASHTFAPCAASTEVDIGHARQHCMHQYCNAHAVVVKGILKRKLIHYGGGMAGRSAGFEHVFMRCTHSILTGILNATLPKRHSSHKIGVLLEHSSRPSVKSSTSEGCSLANVTARWA
jgi:hypothetical protein